jgi:hypothetical protein
VLLGTVPAFLETSWLVSRISDFVGTRKNPYKPEKRLTFSFLLFVTLVSGKLSLPILALRY